MQERLWRAWKGEAGLSAVISNCVVVVSRCTNIVPQYVGTYYYRLWFIFQILLRVSCALYLKHFPEFIWFIFETMYRFSYGL